MNRIAVSLILGATLALTACGKKGPPSPPPNQPPIYGQYMYPRDYTPLPSATVDQDQPGVAIKMPPIPATSQVKSPNPAFLSNPDQ